MNRISVVFLSLLPLCQLRAQDDISLNGEWSLNIQGKDYKVTVPQTYNLMDGLEDYAGEAVYTRSLPITSDMKGKTLRLHFQAVYHDAIVYVNGQKVGEHLNKGYTPFSMDITRYVKWDGENTLEVRTSNEYTEHSLPYVRNFDWVNDGGIYRDVSLHISGKNAIRYVHATPSNDGSVQFAIRLFDEKTKSIKGQLTITDRQTGEKVCDTTVSLAKAKQAIAFTTAATIRDPKLWDFDHPNLYDFTFTIPGSDKLSDHFGFRDFRIAGTSFILNGDTVRLPGIESMAGSNVLYGAAEPKEYIYKTISVMKQLNTTITRFHWQQDNRTLDATDEMGMLVAEQIPWWAQPHDSLNAELRQNAREQLEEMIEAHYNHPSIFAWGTSNEVSGINEELRNLGPFTRQLDPSRIVMDFSNITHVTLAQNTSCVLDLPTWNEYMGTWHGGVREDLPAELAKIHQAIPDRPLLISEAGLCEPAHAGGDARRASDMFYHVSEWQKCDFIPAYIYFCLQDYRTQMGEEGFGKWRIRRHGVTHTDLSPKPSFSMLRQLMSPVEITAVKPAGKGINVTLRVRNNIPSYTIRGYKLSYKNADGADKTIALPDMKPGESQQFTLPDINAQYHFEVLRPTGGSVIEY